MATPESLKKDRVKRVLEETLLVEVTDFDGQGKKQMTVSREYFDAQKKDLNLRVVKVLKPEGVTMEQHLKGQTKTAAPTAAATGKGKTRAKPKAKPKTEVPPAPADEEDDESTAANADALKEEIEKKSMQELLAKHGQQ